MERLTRFVNARPDNADLRYYLATAKAEAGDLAGAKEELQKVMAMGEGYYPVPDQFTKLANDPEYQALIKAMDARLTKAVKARRVAKISDPEFFPEGVAYDPKGKQLFIASMRDGRIWRLSLSGKQRPFNAGEAIPRLGLTINPKGELCTVETNGFLKAAESKRINRLRCFTINSGQPARSVMVPDADQLNDLVFTADGTAYLSDSGGGAIWKIDSDDKVSKFQDGVAAANGLTLDGKGNLYIGHATGIARLGLDGKTGVGRIPNRTKQTVGAIDGLYWQNGKLYGVQNATNAGRLIAISLDAEGEISAVDTLLSHHHPDMAEPTTAALDEKQIYLLATTNVTRVQPDGSIKDQDRKTPAVIVAVPIK